MNVTEEREELPGDLERRLRAAAPAPEPAFKRRLDRLVADGFEDERPKAAADSDDSDRPAARPGLGARLRRRLGAAVPRDWRPAPVLSGLASVAAIVVALAIVVPQLDSGEPEGGSAVVSTPDLDADLGGAAADSSRRAIPEAAIDRADPAPGVGGVVPPFGGPADSLAPGVEDRVIERDATMTLEAEPAQVSEVAGRIQQVAARHDVIVSHHSMSEAAASARAEFILEVPVAGLNTVLAELARLAEVRERSEASQDITAPTVTAADRVQSSRTEVRRLLDRLAEAETDEQAEEVRPELRRAQRALAVHRAELTGLRAGAAFATVHVSVLGGQTASYLEPDEDPWSVGDAASDALRILTVAAGVVLIAAAILLPLAALLTLFALARRLWLRRSRDRALRED